MIVETKPNWIMSVKDLSDLKNPEHYSIDSEYKGTIKNRHPDILETLLNSPLFCTIPERLSDEVLHLKRDFDVSIDTETNGEGRKYYRPQSIVERICEKESVL